MDWLVDWLIDWSIDRLGDDWLINWLIDWLVSWLFDRLFDWLVNQMNYFDSHDILRVGSVVRIPISRKHFSGIDSNRTELETPYDEAGWCISVDIHDQEKWLPACNAEKQRPGLSYYALLYCDDKSSWLLDEIDLDRPIVDWTNSPYNIKWREYKTQIETSDSAYSELWKYYQRNVAL